MVHPDPQFQLRAPSDPCPRSVPTVLIVGEDTRLLALVCDVLHLEGMHTVRVDHAQPDTEADPAVQPDVVLIDLALRGGCGIQVATELQQHGFASTPMIALTASLGELELARQCELFRLVIPKPFDVHQLLGSISEAVPA